MVSGYSRISAWMMGITGGCTCASRADSRSPLTPRTAHSVEPLHSGEPLMRRTAHAANRSCGGHQQGGAIGTGQVGHRAQLPFVPQGGVGKGGNIVSCGCRRITTVAPRSTAARASGTRAPAEKAHAAGSCRRHRAHHLVAGDPRQRHPWIQLAVDQVQVGTAHRARPAPATATRPDPAPDRAPCGPPAAAPFVRRSVPGP